MCWCLCIHLELERECSSHYTLYWVVVICAVCSAPVWFYAWSERQMFIPQGVYSHTHAHTHLVYTVFYTHFIAAQVPLYCSL